MYIHAWLIKVTFVYVWKLNKSSSKEKAYLGNQKLGKKKNVI